MDKNVIIIGSGSWGTSLALAIKNKFSTYLFVRNTQQAESIRKHRENIKYLPGIKIPEYISIINDLKEILKSLEHKKFIIILAVPISELRNTIINLYNIVSSIRTYNISIIYTCKGLEEHTFFLPHEIISDIQISNNFFNYGVLSGPSFAKEIALSLPAALTIASNCKNLINTVIELLHGTNIYVYPNTDIIGVEVGGALKNIIAIACGISDGLKLGLNARAAIITKGLSEIQNFGIQIGAKYDTFFGLTGLGDLVLTATGDISRNRFVGLEISQGKKIEEIMKPGFVAEGVNCSKAVLTRSRLLDIKIPIIESVNNILFNNSDPKIIVNNLLSI